MTIDETKEMIINSIENTEDNKFLNFLLSLILHRARNKKDWTI